MPGRPDNGPTSSTAPPCAGPNPSTPCEASTTCGPLRSLPVTRRRTAGTVHRQPSAHRTSVARRPAPPARPPHGRRGREGGRAGLATRAALSAGRPGGRWIHGAGRSPARTARRDGCGRRPDPGRVMGRIAMPTWWRAPGSRPSGWPVRRGWPVRDAGARRRDLPLAALPPLLGAHRIVEAAVRDSGGGSGPATVLLPGWVRRRPDPARLPPERTGTGHRVQWAMSRKRASARPARAARPPCPGLPPPAPTGRLRR
ncbi:DUF6629 family protein [Streptomyces sp. NPDC060000]|uniref:DUF6629 family protein n=1 Tax=Streptomyces sp. NPDC060000 TaxID=3347031 RepID=UPI003684A978